MSDRAPLDPRKLLTWLGLLLGATGLMLHRQVLLGTVSVATALAGLSAIALDQTSGHRRVTADA